MFIDTHCHLFFDSFSEDLDCVINRALDRGIEKIIVPCVDIASCKKAIEIAQIFSPIFVAVGIHPNDLKSCTDQTMIQLENFLSLDKVIAIGEIGLDYYRNPSSAGRQKQIFRAQLALAEEYHKPVIIHERNAQNDLVDILRDYRINGVFHGFTGSNLVQEFGLEHNYMFGIGGPITYKKRLLSNDSLSKIQNNIVLETDSPFLSPLPFRGKRNEPAHVINIAESLSSLLHCDIINLANRTTNNAKSLFHI